MSKESDWLDDIVRSDAPSPKPVVKPRKPGGVGKLVAGTPMSPEELKAKYGGGVEIPKVRFSEILDDGTVVETGRNWPANYRGVMKDD
jgi:hypothetical protein